MGKEEFSISLMPSGGVNEKLKELISKLSKTYNGPDFEPHVTLLGNIAETRERVIEKSVKLASIMKPFEITLKKVDYLDEYFKCLFIRTEESKELMNYNLQAREIFNKKGPKFMPHLSILYGNYFPKVKEKIIGEIGKEFKETFEANKLFLVRSPKNSEPKDWEIIKEISL